MIGEIALVGIFITLILLLISYEWGDRRLRAMAELLPGPKRFPIVGNFAVASMPGNGAGLLEMRRELIREYGHTSKFWIGNELYVVISDPDDVEAILNKTTDLNKDRLYKYLIPWLGTGLLLSGGQKWFGRRKAITPAFHFKILESFVDVFNKNGDVLCEVLNKEVDGAASFDVQPYISRFTLDVICETAMGVEVNSQKNSSPYVVAVRRILKHLFNRMWNPLFRNDFLYYICGKKAQENELVKIVHSFTNKVIGEKKLAYEENIALSNANEEGTGIKSKTAFLELLIKLSKQPDSVIKTDEDIREEVDTFMFEGHDTTTSALSSLLHVLSKHPDTQDKCYKEVQEVMQGKDCMNPSHQDLQEMKYLECVIKETMRLYPPVPAIARDLREDIKLASGYVAPKGSLALISLYFLHRNDKYFTNPEVFNPDNFLPDNAAGRHPYAYVPFSAGQRNCIGQKFAMLELKSTISKVLCRYNILDPGSEKNIIPNPTLTLQSVNGFHVKLAQR